MYGKCQPFEPSNEVVFWLPEDEAEAETPVEMAVDVGMAETEERDMNALVEEPTGVLPPMSWAASECMEARSELDADATMAEDDADEVAEVTCGSGAARSTHPGEACLSHRGS